MTLLTWYKKWTLAVVELVNTPRGSGYAQYRTRYLLTPARRQELFSVASLAVERGVAHATTGEISVRLSHSQLGITVQRADLARLSEADIVTAAIASDAPLPQAAAQHGDWHRAIYEHTAAGGVLLCQPPHALALAHAGRLPDADNEVYAAVGGAHLVEADIAVALREQAPNYHALLVRGVGALVWGASARDAVYRTEALEYAARLTVVAANLRLRE